MRFRYRLSATIIYMAAHIIFAAIPEPIPYPYPIVTFSVG